MDMSEQRFVIKFQFMNGLGSAVIHTKSETTARANRLGHMYLDKPRRISHLIHTARKGGGGILAPPDYHQNRPVMIISRLLLVISRSSSRMETSRNRFVTTENSLVLS
jgi:hypothetical protein